MTVRNPLVLIPGGNPQIQELPAGDTIGGAPIGQTGPAGTIEIGTVTTVDPGDPATVTNVGTDTAAILDFEIPQGDTGAQGADGEGGWIKAGLTVPLASAFSTFGSGITVTDKSDRMQVSVTSASGTLRGQTRNSISTPYTIDMGCGYIGNPANADASWFGIAVSDGTKYRTLYAGSVGFGTNNVVNRVVVDSWTNASSFSATVRAEGITFNPYGFFLRITDDGSNRKFYLSTNYKDFFPVYSEATNTFLTPSKFGIVCYNNSANSIASLANVQHWLVTSSVLGDAS